jgi:hypothetical protein
MEKEKECNRALEDPWGAVGLLIAQKRPGAKTGALPDQTGESKPETEFPATTLRAKALTDMHRNYEEAEITLVHDCFLRNLKCVDAETACFAIVMSPWFSRGWTAVELAKSKGQGEGGVRRTRRSCYKGS